MKRISIIGFGRFGKTLFRLIKGDFEIVLFDPDESAFNELSKQNRSLTTSNLLKVFASDAVFYCVPINKFESIISSHRKYFRPSNLLVDVLSVKVHPKKVFLDVLMGLKTQALLTHPMFG